MPDPAAAPASPAPAEPAPRWTPELTQWLPAAALAAGFDQAGIAPAPPAAHPAATLTAQRFTHWLAKGHAGEMDYLARRNHHGDLLRLSARNALPWARSLIVCAFNYNALAPRSIDPAPPSTGWIARYAWNGAEPNCQSVSQSPHPNALTPNLEPTDYHQDLLARLRLLESALLAHAPGTLTRCYVDTGPLLERDFAARAGIGWTGKNTCTLSQSLGSWLLLAVIVTSLEPALTPTLPAPDRCGTCTRCLDACPTHALIAPRQMDASRCIAYLTIEKKGSIDPTLRAPIGRQVFGCDICQDVCPWNRRAPIAAKPALTASDGTPHPALATRPELVNPSLHWLGTLTQPDFRRLFRGSPLERTRLPRLQRNIAIAMGNSADPTHIPRLREWAQGPDPILAEAAHWALARLTQPPPTPS